MKRESSAALQAAHEHIVQLEWYHQALRCCIGDPGLQPVLKTGSSLPCCLLPAQMFAAQRLNPASEMPSCVPLMTTHSLTALIGSVKWRQHQNWSQACFLSTSEYTHNRSREAHLDVHAVAQLVPVLAQPGSFGRLILCCQLQSLLCAEGLVVSAALLPACQALAVRGMLPQDCPLEVSPADRAWTSTAGVSPKSKQTKFVPMASPLP